jgi:hypothetical protein
VKGTPPVLATINYVWAAIYAVSAMSAGWTSRVAGIEVTVGEGPGDGEMTEVGVAAPFPRLSLDMTMTWPPRQSPQGVA